MTRWYHIQASLFHSFFPPTFRYVILFWLKNAFKAIFNELIVEYANEIILFASRKVNMQTFGFPVWINAYNLRRFCHLIHDAIRSLMFQLNKKEKNVLKVAFKPIFNWAMLHSTTYNGFLFIFNRTEGFQLFYYIQLQAAVKFEWNKLIITFASSFDCVLGWEWKYCLIHRKTTSVRILILKNHIWHNSTIEHWTISLKFKISDAIHWNKS